MNRVQDLLLALLYVVTSCSSVHAQITQPDSTQVGSDLAIEAYVEFSQRLSVEEWNLYEPSLSLTPDQEHAIRVSLTAFLSECEKLDNEKKQTLWEQAAHVAEIIRDNIYLPEQSRLVERHYGDVREFIEEEVVLEERFFDSVNEVLSKSQQEALVWARYSRERLRYPPQSATIPGASLDMVTLVAELGIDLAMCTPFVQSYETEIGPLRRKRYEEDLYRRVFDAKFLSEHATHMDQGALDVRAMTLRRLVRIDKRLRATNLFMLENLLICLDEGDAARVREAARRLMYRRLFPDTLANDIRSKAVARRDVYPTDAPEYAACDELIRGFDARYEAVVTVLIEHIVADREQFSSTHYAFADDRAAQEALFGELLEKRNQLSRDFDREFSAFVLEFRDETELLSP